MWVWVWVWVCVQVCASVCVQVCVCKCVCASVCVQVCASVCCFDGLCCSRLPSSYADALLPLLSNTLPAQVAAALAKSARPPPSSGTALPDATSDAVKIALRVDGERYRPRVQGGCFARPLCASACGFHRASYCLHVPMCAYFPVAVGAQAPTARAADVLLKVDAWLKQQQRVVSSSTRRTDSGSSSESVCWTSTPACAHCGLRAPSRRWTFCTS